MTKEITPKEYLLTLFSMVPDSVISEGIKALIEDEQLDEETLKSLTSYFMNVVQNTQKKIAKKKFHKSMESLHAKKTQEMQTKAKETQQADQEFDELLDTV